jgi:hypothetical protein
MRSCFIYFPSVGRASDALSIPYLFYNKSKIELIPFSTAGIEAEIFFEERKKIL